MQDWRDEGMDGGEGYKQRVNSECSGWVYRVARDGLDKNKAIPGGSIPGMD